MNVINVFIIKKLKLFYPYKIPPLFLISGLTAFFLLLCKEIGSIKIKTQKKSLFKKEQLNVTISVMNSNYEKARERVIQKKKFYLQLLAYLGVSVAGLIVFAYPSSRLFFMLWLWFLFVMFICGVNLIYRYYKIFGLPEIITDLANIPFDWEEKAIQREVERMENPAHPKQDQALEDREGLKLKELQREKRRIDDTDLV